jgi:hypothetical protein
VVWATDTPFEKKSIVDIGGRHLREKLKILLSIIGKVIDLKALHTS